MYSFLILSILLTQSQSLNILASASCLFVSATVFKPYIIAGLATVLCTLSFTLATILLSQITLTFVSIHSTLLQSFLHLTCEPLIWTVDTRHLYSSTFAIAAPCIFSVTSGCQKRLKKAMFRFCKNVFYCSLFTSFFLTTSIVIRRCRWHPGCALWSSRSQSLLVCLSIWLTRCLWTERW